MQFTKNKKVLRFLWQFVHRREWNLSSLRFPYHIVIAAVRGKLCKKVFWSQTGKHSPKTIRDHLCKMEHLQKKLRFDLLSKHFSFLIQFLNFCMKSNQKLLQSLKKGRIIGSRSHFLLFISPLKEAPPFNKSFFVRKVELGRRDISILRWLSTRFLTKSLKTEKYLVSKFKVEHYKFQAGKWKW